MPTKGSDVRALLRDCETRLLESRRSVEEAIDLVRRTATLLAADPRRGASDAPIEALFGNQREELVNLVLSALDNGDAPRQAREEFVNALIYRVDEKRYRVGRRVVALTESERHVLDILWAAMPMPVSRQELHASLYAGDEKAALATIDVFVSNLRQKLKLASGGRDFIQSVRGHGWALKPELCRNRHAESEDPTDSPAQRTHA